MCTWPDATTPPNGTNEISATGALDWVRVPTANVARAVIIAHYRVWRFGITSRLDDRARENVGVTVEQSLVGAMGCASWRARRRLVEYASLAPDGGVISSGPHGLPQIGVPQSWGLSEVGVTDAVMTTLWRAGPNGAAYAVSSRTESAHLGADLAIIRRQQRRIMLHQAKLARLDGSDFRLKSRVSQGQARLLRRREVTVNGTCYTVTGRLALYQAEWMPFPDRCDLIEWCGPWGIRWFRDPERQRWERDPAIGRDYYKRVLDLLWSPAGVLAAPVVRARPMSSIPARATWPWEFDFYHWCGDTSWLDTPGGSGSQDPDFEPLPPRFEPYEAARGANPPRDLADILASELPERLGLPRSRQLHVIVI